jgi:flagellar protein FlaG
MIVEPVKNTEGGIASPAPAKLAAESGQAPGDKGAAKPVQEPSSDHLAELAAAVQQNLKLMHNVDLQFSVHQASGQMMVVVKEESTGKVIREIPPKEVLNLAAKLDELAGMLLDKKG